MRTDYVTRAQLERDSVYGPQIRRAKTREELVKVLRKARRDFEQLITK